MVLNKHKPLGQKAYGSIPHLPGSRRGPADKGITEQQAKMCTTRALKKNGVKDVCVVQEKLDGSNVAVAKLDGNIIPLGRAGYVAWTSPHRMHRVFAEWVAHNQARFEYVLEEGERLCGEWLWQAHGTRYDLPHEPFVVFDLMRGSVRTPYETFVSRVAGTFIVPHVLHIGAPCPVARAMELLGTYGYHGALEPAEGAVWRVERAGKVVLVAKYVRPAKVDGKYLPKDDTGPLVLNTFEGDDYGILRLYDSVRSTEEN